MTDTTDREQLISLIRTMSLQKYEYDERVADTLLDEGWRPPPRRITDVDELSALPNRSVVHNGYRGYTHVEGGWWVHGDDSDMVHGETILEIDVHGVAQRPASVLWAPDGDHA